MKPGDTMVKTYTDCPVEYTASLLGNKWNPLILRELLTGTKRYNELSRSVVGISPKVLTQNLRNLEENGILERIVYPEVPPKVEYMLTKKGWELEPIIEAMRVFGLKYRHIENTGDM